ncbi:fungal-specific transcription factor domain-containing protein [Aspergillus tamarii]|uniref:Fungal-specific transcription factor domain-containing protein n=1 Tax=Aspergillus tamarii TaxID=41984 RepID=A0A5N6UE96_ASPTM|nr:fungal-specific transcription factor domain-containing protein [Aspergillus tamarii]
MRLPPEQPEKTRHPLSGMTSYISSQHPSPCVSRPSKVPIPRLSIHNEVAVRPRAKKACKECRDVKTKCDGYQPCGRCVGFGIDCIYVNGKKESQERRLQDLEKQVQVYEKLLRQLQLKVMPEDEELVARALAEFSRESTDTVTDHSHFQTGREDLRLGVECVQEDFHGNRRLQPIGFIGGPEITWVRDLNRAVEKDTGILNGNTPNQFPSDDSQALSKVSYFLDDQEITIDDDIGVHIRPSPDIAERLTHLYFHTVHPSFPIISRVSFTQQLESYYTKPYLRPTKKWLAILNLVFAAAAKFAHLVPQHLVQAMEAPMVYFSRAQRLNFTGSQLIDHPDLQQVQVEGLIAFLCMAFGHINRSWRACGVAIRSSIAMGINLRSESKEISNISKEIRYRVWWSLYTLENTLSTMTGRPPATADRFCTTPLPIPFEEEQFHVQVAVRLLADFDFRTEYMRAFAVTRHRFPATPDPPAGKASGQNLAADLAEIVPSTSLYFVYFVQLTEIMRRAIDLLYSPGFATRPWLTINTAMLDLVDETDEWLAGLPVVFQFTCYRTAHQFRRQRWSLAFRFHSVRITICRPSLCRSARQEPGTELCTEVQKAAELCIDSACQILDLLPNEPDIVWLNQVSPWWCVLHYLMQSVTVLLIEFEYCGRVSTDNTVRVNSMIEKALMWLSALAIDSLAAQRASEVCHDLYRRLFLRSTVEQSRQPELSTIALPTTGLESSSSQPIYYPFNHICSVPHGTGGQSTMDSASLHNVFYHPVFQTPYDEFRPCNFDRM